MSTPLNVRLPAELNKSLETYRNVHGLTRTAAATQLLEAGLAHNGHAGEGDDVGSGSGGEAERVSAGPDTAGSSADRKRAYVEGRVRQLRGSLGEPAARKQAVAEWESS